MSESQKVGRREFMHMGLLQAGLVLAPSVSMALSGRVTGARNTHTLPRILANAGCSSNLVLALDPAAAGSYPGSGQLFSDLSGNGANYYLGATSSVGTGDPVFNGTSGSLNEDTYFSFTSDYFTPTSAQTWAHTWHTGSAAFSFLLLVYLPTGSLTATHRIFSNANSSAQVGINIYLHSSGSFVYRAYNGSGSSSLQKTIAVVTPADRWYVLMFSYHAATGTFTYKIDNSAVQTTIGTLTSPSSAAPSENYKLFADPDNLNPVSNNVRLGGMAAWNQVLSASQMDAIYSRLKRQRMPSLP